MSFKTDVAEDDVVIVRVVGDVVDSDTVQELRETFTDILDGPDGSGTNVKVIIVDLSETTVLSGQGIGQLIIASGRCETRGGDLVAFGAAGAVWNTLSNAGIDNVFRFFPDEGEAIAYLTGDRAKCA